jgi:hypothetical protein
VAKRAREESTEAKPPAAKRVRADSTEADPPLAKRIKIEETAVAEPAPVALTPPPFLSVNENVFQSGIRSVKRLLWRTS